MMRLRRGFTLLEMMVAIAIAAFVVAGLYGLFTVQSRQFLYQDLQMEMHQNLRFGTDVLSRSLRLAGYNTNGRFGQPITVADQFEQNRGGSVSLSLSVPILDRGQTRIARTRASIQEENAQLTLAQTRQRVALDVRTAWYNIRSAHQQLVAAQAGLVAATQALEATQQRYNVGAATLLEVTQLRAQRVNAQSNLADAQYNLVLNQAAMAYFTGELEPAGMMIGR